MRDHRTDLPNEPVDLPNDLDDLNESPVPSDSSSDRVDSTDRPSPTSTNNRSSNRALYFRDGLRLFILIMFIAGSVYAMLSVVDPAGKRSGDVVPADETYGATSIDADQRVVEYDGSFKLEDYVKKNELVVLELKTEWCWYCKEFESRLGDIIERDARVRVVMIDVEKYEEFGKRYDVVGTPTFVRYVSGKQKDVRVGSLSTEDFVKWVNE